MEVLLKHGARIDVEARMCWPGPHNQNCEQRGKYCKYMKIKMIFVVGVDVEEMRSGEFCNRKAKLKYI